MPPFAQTPNVIPFSFTKPQLLTHSHPAKPARRDNALQSLYFSWQLDLFVWAGIWRSGALVEIILLQRQPFKLNNNGIPDEAFQLKLIRSKEEKKRIQLG